MPRSFDKEHLKKVLEEHRFEIASELGLESPRNANADPDSPMSSRTGRIITRDDLPDR